MDTNSSWSLIESLFHETPHFLVKHHLDSYDHFLHTQLRELLVTGGPLVFDLKNLGEFDAFKMEIYLCGKDGNRFLVESPFLYNQCGGKEAQFPQSARRQKSTYAVSVYIDVEIVVYYTKGPVYEEYCKNKDQLSSRGGLCSHIARTELIENVFLGKIPLMVQSCSCHLHKLPAETRSCVGESIPDPGGYFIIDGIEKAFTSREQARPNFLYTYPDHVKIYSSKEVNAPADVLQLSALRWNKRTKQIEVQISGIIPLIPLFLLFRALGVEEDAQIFQLCNPGTERNGKIMVFACLIRPSVFAHSHITTQEGALEWLKSNCIELQSNMHHFIAERVLPHCSTDGSNFSAKAHFLGYMVKEMLLIHIGMKPHRDVFFKEHMSHPYNKSVLLAGAWLGQIVKSSLAEFRTNVHGEIATMIKAKGSRFPFNLEELPRFSRTTLDSRVVEHDILAACELEHLSLLNRSSHNSIICQLRQVISNVIPLDTTDAEPGDGSGAGADADADTDVDADADTNADANGGSDSVADVDVDYDYDADSYSVADSGSGADSDYEAESGGSSGRGGRECINEQNILSTLHESLRGCWGIYDSRCDKVVNFGDSLQCTREMCLMARITSEGLTNGENLNAWLRARFEQTKERARFVEDEPAGFTLSTNEWSKVFIDGRWVVSIKDPISLIEDMRRHRRTNNLPWYISISFDYCRNLVEIWSCAGRLCRPVFYSVYRDGAETGASDILPKNATRVQKWPYLIKQLLEESEEFMKKEWDKAARDTLPIYNKDSGNDENMGAYNCIEYLDANEEQLCVVSLFQTLPPSQNCTHMEINNSTAVFSYMGLLRPFAEHNTSLEYHSNTVSMYHTNYPNRIDDACRVLVHGQIPLAKTKMFDISNLEVAPYGQNATVVILENGPNSLHNCIRVNKASLDRGLFTFLRKKRGEEVKGEVCPPFEMEMDPKYFMRQDGETPATTSGPRLLETNFSQMSELYLERLQLGDSLVTRHGSRNMIVEIVEECDIPFSSRGDRPDILVSANSVVRAQQVSLLMEMLGSLGACLAGCTVDATCFQGKSESRRKLFESFLSASGFHTGGLEMYYDGISGNAMQGNVYSGIVYTSVDTSTPEESAYYDAERREGDESTRSPLYYSSLVAHGLTETLRDNNTSVTVSQKSGLLAGDEDEDACSIYLSSDVKRLYFNLLKNNVAMRFVTDKDLHSRSFHEIDSARESSWRKDSHAYSDSSNRNARFLTKVNSSRMKILPLMPQISPILQEAEDAVRESESGVSNSIIDEIKSIGINVGQVDNAQTGGGDNSLQEGSQEKSTEIDEAKHISNTKSNREGGTTNITINVTRDNESSAGAETGNGTESVGAAGDSEAVASSIVDKVFGGKCLIKKTTPQQEQKQPQQKDQTPPISESAASKSAPMASGKDLKVIKM